MDGVLSRDKQRGGEGSAACHRVWPSLIFRQNSQRGASLVEYAFLLVVISLLLFGVIASNFGEIGKAFNLISNVL